MDSTHAANFRSPDRWNSVPIPDRVAQRAIARVDRRPDGCWISQYSVASHGYAQVGWSIPPEERRGRGRTVMVLAHRAAWTAVNGQVPLGMTIDHLCKERRCVNPDHLRVLPNFENARRTDGRDWPIGYCANGHPSTRLGRGGKRRTKSGRMRVEIRCADCRNLYVRRNKWRASHPGYPMPEHLMLASELKRRNTA